MGVRDLFPFLQKRVPHVFKDVPNRLQGLRGKTLVIDGTLITQRLHYSPSPYEYRHVLGWYRVIRQLQENGVGAICVFDGPDRARAKARERARRQDARQLALARATLETERVTRLERISTLLHKFRNLQARQPRRSVIRRVTAPTWRRPVVPFVEVRHTLDAEELHPEVEEQLDEFDYSRVSDLEASVDPLDALQDESVIRAMNEPSSAEWNLEELGLRKDEIDAILSSVELEHQTEGKDEPQGEDEVREQTVHEELSSLRRQYEQSVPKFRLPALVTRHIQAATLPPVTEATEETPVMPSFEDATEGDLPNEHTMSRFQYDLMVREGALWESLDEDMDGANTAVDAAHHLHIRSAAIVASYAKRNTHPSERTYEESRQMLRALGVPCISSEGAIEGEAFASALVHAGLADYVATEDTDVVVYDAPMLRGLTSLRSPLYTIDGVEVRSALSLTRESFIDFALLLGTDFSIRLKGLGPINAINLIQQHGSIEAILESPAGAKYRRALLDDEAVNQYLEEVRQARQVFQTLPAVSKEAIEEVHPDEERVRELLRAFNLERAADEGETVPARRNEPGFGVEYWSQNGQHASLPVWKNSMSIGPDTLNDSPVSNRARVRQFN